jgi:formate C-acetyltransferase
MQKVDKKEINKVRVMTERLQTLKKEWENAPATVYVDDTLLFTESWKATEGLPIDIRWAKAFEKRMLESPIRIRENELIVGQLTKFVRGNSTLAAMKPREILAMCESGQFDRKTSDISSTNIDPDDLLKLKADAEYWVNVMPRDNFVNEAIRYEFGEEHFDLMFDRSMIFEGRAVREKIDRGLFQNWGAFGGGVCMPTRPAVDKGLSYIIKIAEAELKKMNELGAQVQGRATNAYRKYYLLKACIISCQAVIAYARRYAVLAQEQAHVCEDHVRKAELLKISDVCANVPANPPRNFWESVQSLRFLHLACWKESSERPEVGIGRIDQILYPYYEKDLADGALTRQDAAELLGSLWLKLRETENLVTIKREHRAAPGTLLPDATLGGRDVLGHDLINEVSWLVLEVMRQTQLSEPAVYIRYHDGIDQQFMLHALECNRDFGGGNPAFLNDELGTARYLDRGVRIEDAVNWCASGCLGYHLDCAEHQGGHINLNQAKIFELTLNNGYDPRTQKQLGPKTGDPVNFKSVDEIIEAFAIQEDHFCETLRKHYFIWWGVEMEHSPMSGLRCAMLYEDCIPAGLCSREGGARYPVCRASWIGDRGVVDIADSLAAIQHLVFATKKVTLPTLLNAMRLDWVGYEALQQLCKNAPKYGNDLEMPDQFYGRILFLTQETMQKRPDPFTGHKPMLFKGAAAGHVTMGVSVGALPNGRNAGKALNDAASSAMPGMDVNGPTALINSATADDLYAYASCGFTHNMKFSKQLLNSEEKLLKLSSLVKIFCDRGGWHIQFNIHDAAELKEAQKNPAAHKNLLVRVGGYSAYFVDLPPELQDEIVLRTMHSAV